MLQVCTRLLIGRLIDTVGCWLLVVGCWLLVVGCWLLVVGCWQPTTSASTDVKWSELTIREKIGQGGFGVVYKGEWKGMAVAVKKVFSEEMDERELESFRMETEIMRYC
jgi:hypothetical protein